MPRKSKFQIKILGAYGGRFKDLGTTCLQISETILVDAGNIMRALGEESLKINHVFITHAHLDHIVDIPFLVDYTFRYRDQALNIYGHRETLDAIKSYVMNWNIWPEFSSIRLLNSGDYAVNYIEIEEGQEIQVDGFTFIPIESNHTVKTFGYIIKKGSSALLFTSDTFKNPSLWERVNEDSSIKAVITEVSFPSYMFNVAEVSKHHTPRTLREDLKNLKRENVDLYVMHLKPSALQELKKEIKEILPEVEILSDGDKIELQ